MCRIVEITILYTNDSELQKNTDLPGSALFQQEPSGETQTKEKGCPWETIIHFRPR